MAPRSKKPSSEADALAYTVSSLAATVQTLTRTVESLSATHVAGPMASDRFERRNAYRQPNHAVGHAAGDVSADDVAGDPATRTATPFGQVIEAYGNYVALFVGAGLISGSIVHFPLDPGRYLVVGAAGGLLFTGASAMGDIRTNGLSRSIIRTIVASLLLSLGIGMISGGVQHFEDFPARAAKLIPLGMALSIAAFIVRQGYRMAVQHLIWLASGVLWAVLILGIALNSLAGSAPASAGHEHGAEPVVVGTSNSTPTSSATGPEPAHADHH